MRVFLDTNVLVAAAYGGHLHHQQAFPVLESVQNGKDEGFVSAHSLAEMYSTLTRLPSPFRHSPEQAFLSIEENVLKHFKIINLTGSDYAALLRESSVIGVQGGTIYDALVLKGAIKAEVDRIFTFNLRHFQAIASDEVKSLLVSP